jgi:hypothetical protein
MSSNYQTVSYARESPLVVTEHPTRHMKSYVVFKWELSSIAAMNAWATLCFTLTSFFASIAFGLRSNIFVADSPSEAAKKYGATIELVCWLAAASMLLLGIWAVKMRKSKVDEIKVECGDVEVTAAWRVKVGRRIAGTN